jgi:hypothetical protein
LAAASVAPERAAHAQAGQPVPPPPHQAPFAARIGTHRHHVAQRHSHSIRTVPEPAQPQWAEHGLDTQDAQTEGHRRAPPRRPLEADGPAGDHEGDGRQKVVGQGHPAQGGEDGGQRAPQGCVQQQQQPGHVRARHHQWQERPQLPDRRPAGRQRRQPPAHQRHEREQREQPAEQPGPPRQLLGDAVGGQRRADQKQPGHLGHPADEHRPERQQDQPGDQVDPGRGIAEGEQEHQPADRVRQQHLVRLEEVVEPAEQGQEDEPADQQQPRAVAAGRRPFQEDREPDAKQQAEDHVEAVLDEQAQRRRQVHIPSVW